MPPHTLSKSEYDDVFRPTSYSEDLVTRSQLEWSWKTHFKTVLPNAVNVVKPDAPMNYKWDEEKQQLVIDNDPKIGYVIPFKRSVEQFLGIKSVYLSVLKSFRRNSEQLGRDSVLYRDIWDGNIIKTNPVFLKCNGSVLGFQIYFDEVETANPLGSKKGKHKMAVFYWVLMNLLPEQRSHLRSIQLLGIVNASVLKECGPS